MCNEDFIFAPEKLAAFNDALRLACWHGDRHGIWFIWYHRLPVLVVAAENKGFFP